MKCLFIVANDPISPNHTGGGGAVFHEQLFSLIELGVEVDLWHFCYEERKKKFNDFIARSDSGWQEIQSSCGNVFLSTIDERPTYFDRVRNKTLNLFSHLKMINPVLRGACYRELSSVITRSRPDFIWAQHFAPVQVALLQSRIPVIYSHHDWLYKVKAVGSGRMEDNRLRILEENVARKASLVVTGSDVERKQLLEVGCPNVHYLPVAYDSVPFEEAADSDVRLVHLGGLATTANRIGLERFFEVVWPELGQARDSMWVVGDVSLASEELRKFLEKVTTVGFVDDLRTVLRPYDIHVIPWERETGQRTRLINAFNFGQAVVSTRKAVACFPEVVDCENALLVDNLSEMADAIRLLFNDDHLRKKLGDRARQTFEQKFTRSSLLPRYRQVLQSLPVNS